MGVLISVIFHHFFRRFPGVVNLLRIGSGWPVLLLIGCSMSESGEFDRTGRLWEPVPEWSLENTSWSGNPFDVEANATFVHEESGEVRTTPLFYDGDSTWKFRFTSARTGLWTFRTESTDSDLDGIEGRIEILPNPNADARGFIVAHGNKFAKQSGENGTLEAFVPNVYMNLRKYGNPEECGWTAISPMFSDPEVFDAYLDEVEAHGSNTAFALIVNQWFQAGAASYLEHNSEDPDPETFRALEQSIQLARERGMHLHIWAWGDEQRHWTPVGVGGINGESDRRLQRYIAARLGPLPGWTMSYGFDLNEWVTEEEIEEWAQKINGLSGWKHLITARPGRGFSEVRSLTLASNDDRLEENFYSLVRKRLENSSDLPVIFERRFSYLRDDVWNMENTRRAFWQFTLAGGAGSMWGHFPPDCSAYKPGNYPNPEQLRTHRTFWSRRFLPDMEPRPDLSNDNNTLVLVAKDQQAVFYREDADNIRLDLSGMNSSMAVVAVDTKKEYGEIEVEQLEPGVHMWNAPYISDWAIAVGTFPSSSPAKME